MYDAEGLAEFDRLTGPALGPTQEYRIGIGDRLDVILMYHSNLSAREVLVRDDGRISLPYVGDQMAMGYTPMDLDSILTGKFGEILKEPSLSVIVHDQAQKKVYVLGHVMRSGEQEYERQVTLVQALALAGGFQNGAKSDHVVLIRRVSATEVVGIEIDAKAIMQGKSVGNDIYLRNYDIVFVPQTRLSSTVEFANQVSTLINLPLQPTMQGWQLANQIESYRYWQRRNAEDLP